MLTVKEEDNVLEIRGLSTDEKPTGKVYGYDVANGSTFFEMDTGNCFMYSAENGIWYQM